MASILRNLLLRTPKGVDIEAGSETIPMTNILKKGPEDLQDPAKITTNPGNLQDLSEIRVDPAWPAPPEDPSGIRKDPACLAPPEDPSEITTNPGNL